MAKHEYTEEERKAIGERLKNGRAKKKADLPADGQLLDSELAEPTFTEVCNAVRAVRADWVTANVPDNQAGSLCELLRDALDHAQKRVQIIENRRNVLTCSACGDPLPNGRDAGPLSFHDPATGQIVALRACSEPCYRQNEARMSKIKLGGNLRGISAIG